MPLTDFQGRLARLLAVNRTPDNYLCGGAALHLLPNTLRYSNHLDYFQDSEPRVASAFAEDSALLRASGYEVQVEVSLPGYIRAVIQQGDERTKVEWARDSSWRFLPTLPDEWVGYRLHPVDLAINKLLALVGRDEPRDFLDVCFTHHRILPLGAQCWAASGKDPGFSPLSLLELLRRRGKYHPGDFAPLALAQPIDLPAMKAEWLEMLARAEAFIESRPAQEAGCLYYDPATGQFVEPVRAGAPVLPHFGRPCGVLPRLVPSL